ncbi:MAG TPA: hypothetical protein VIL85_04620 [Thermomicrobiales bacterium]|jgi:hypothetical protein
MPPGLTPLEEDLLAAFDPGEIVVYAAGLTAALSDAGRDRTVAFIRAQLRTWGITSTAERFDALVSLPGAARLSLARRDAPVPALTLPYSPATPDGGLVAELRATTPEEAAGADLTGSVALVDGPPDLALVALLAARGAVAQVYISPNETLKPTAVPDLWGGPAATPAMVIGRAAGEGFLALCAAGATPVRLSVEAAWTTERLTLPVATITGADEPDDFLLLGVPGPSPDDGVEAAACLLELCRLLAGHAGRLRRGVRCVWWPGGAAPAAGPVWYTEHAWEGLRQHAIGYVELHPPKRRGGKALSAWSGRGLRAFADVALREGGVRAISWADEPAPPSDAPFARLGLPTIRLAAAQAGGLGASIPLLARLCTSPLLPFEPAALSRTVETRVRAVLDATAGRLELAPLGTHAAAFQGAIERLQIALLHIAQGESPNYEEGVALGNRLLRRLNGLLLPTLWHPGDPYETPPSGAAYPFPGLDAVGLFLDSDGTDIAETMRPRATAIRERNRALDALDAATAAIDDALTDLRQLGFG